MFIVQFILASAFFGVVLSTQESCAPFPRVHTPFRRKRVPTYSVVLTLFGGACRRHIPRPIRPGHYGRGIQGFFLLPYVCRAVRVDVVTQLVRHMMRGLFAGCMSSITLPWKSPRGYSVVGLSAYGVYRGYVGCQANLGGFVFVLARCGTTDHISPKNPEVELAPSALVALPILACFLIVSSPFNIVGRGYIGKQGCPWLFDRDHTANGTTTPSTKLKSYVNYSKDTGVFDLSSAHVCASSICDLLLSTPLHVVPYQAAVFFRGVSNNWHSSSRSEVSLISSQSPISCPFVPLSLTQCRSAR